MESLWRYIRHLLAAVLGEMAARSMILQLV